MIRLGPGVETELQMTFTRPGSFLVYCTSYCGPGHDGMQARITVV
jgi:heme/copper-type cytochrome/quinol oxidase subunit 2